jgi:hypothetical protein
VSLPSKVNSQKPTYTVFLTPSQDQIDLDDIAYGANTTLAYTPNSGSTGGTLTVSDGTHIANLSFIGQYTQSSFAAASDGNGGTLLTDPPTPVTIADGTTFEISSPTADAVTFGGSTGTLQLDQSQSFTGTVAGFGGGDEIDLEDITFGANTTLAYAANSGNSGGTLTVSDGSHVANIALLGQYLASNFVTASDGNGGTLITDPPPSQQQQQLTQPH